MANMDKNPQNGQQGTSYIYDMGTSPNTRTAVSQKVRILTPVYGDNKALHQMGVLSSLNTSENKTVDEVRGIGYGDKIAELVPSITTAMTASFERALMYLCNLWQATGYASGVDGPVRSLRDHRWPFDMEQQLVFSTLADKDLGVPNVGYNGTSGKFDGGVKAISYPQVTTDNGPQPGAGGSVSGSSTNQPADRAHSAIITVYEACWFTSWSVNYSKDTGVIMESGEALVSDVHDFSSVYGEFLASGNDPSTGQLGSMRFSEQGFSIAQSGRGIGGGSAASTFATSALNVAP